MKRWITALFFFGLCSPMFAPDTLLKAVYDDLKPWITERKGAISLAGDPNEVIDALMDGPKSFRVVLNWAGDKDQTGQPFVGIVDHSLEVYLIKSKGLRLNPGELLIAGPVDNPPFLRLLSDLRSRLRSWTYPVDDTNQYLLYKGTDQLDPVHLAQLPTTGFKMTFELTAAIENITYRT